jgi:hypothetical protein
MGVLYHLRYPLLALDLIHEHVARDLLVFQSMHRGSDKLEPIASDYPFKEKNVFNRPSFPACISSKRSTQATRLTGGYQIALARKPCSVALDSQSSVIRNQKCTFAAAES